MLRIRLRPSGLAVAAALLVLAGQSPAEGVISTLKGEPQRGLSLHVKGSKLAFQSPADGQTELDLAEVVEVIATPRPNPPPENTRIFEVELTCGSRLRGTLAKAPADFVTLRSPIFGERQIDIETVAAIRRVAGKKLPPASQLVAVEDSDVAYRLGGGRIQGVVIEFDANGFTMDRGKQFGKRKIAYRELAAVFVDTEKAKPVQGLHARITTTAGGVAILRRGFVIEGGMVRGETPSGMSLRFPVGQLAAMHLAGGRFVYVSDLPIANTERKPFFPLPEGGAKEAMLQFVCPVRKDTSPDGRPIHLRQRRFYKGIGVRPYTALTFDLTKGGGGFERFETLCGIDDEVLGPGYGRGGGSGSVVFEVWLDGKRVAQTGVVRGGAEPVPVRADVTGGKQLQLIVRLVPADKLADGVTDSPALDNAVWARPLLVR